MTDTPSPTDPPPKMILDRLLEDDARALADVAVALSHALSEQDDAALAQALDQNLQLWVAIRTLATRDTNALPREVRDNLIQLSHFVAQKTFEMREGFPPDSVEALARINLQICEGLLEGRKATPPD